MFVYNKAHASSNRVDEKAFFKENENKLVNIPI